MTKICSKCKQEKSIESFYKAPYGKFNRGNKCIACVSLYGIENRNKRKKYLQSYRIRNREYLNKKANERYYKNHEERKLQGRLNAKKYGEKNKLKISERRKSKRFLDKEWREKVNNRTKLWKKKNGYKNVSTKKLETCYIKNLIVGKNKIISRSEISPEFICLYRDYIILKRLKKEKFECQKTLKQ